MKGVTPREGEVSLGEAEVRGGGLEVMLRYRTLEMEKQTNKRIRDQHTL